MSFSGEVKEELSMQIASARHCMLAELAAMLTACGRASYGEQKVVLTIESENRLLIRKCFTLLKKTFNIETVCQEPGAAGEEIPGHLEISKSANEILTAMKWPDHQAEMKRISPMLLKSSCCKRAALRGLFLANGSMSNPQGAYHLEFVCAGREMADEIVELISSFELEAKVVERGKYQVVYMKEGAAIVDLLNIMEAHRSLMNLENLRILKDISNSINRRVNCETANIMKTVNAAGRQVSDIRLIENTRGFKSLPDGLREAAVLRLTYPDMTLSELAAAMSPPIGKSGMNHRLRKLSEIAREIRGE